MRETKTRVLFQNPTPACLHVHIYMGVRGAQSSVNLLEQSHLVPPGAAAGGWLVWDRTCQCFSEWLLEPCKALQGISSTTWYLNQTSPLLLMQLSQAASTTQEANGSRFQRTEATAQFSQSKFNQNILIKAEICLAENNFLPAIDLKFGNRASQCPSLLLSS